MLKLLKLIKALRAKGFALSSEKAEVTALYKELEADEQETVKEEVEATEALPENDPKEAEAENEIVQNIVSKVDQKSKENLSTEVAKLKAEMDKEIAEWKKEQKELIEAKAGAYQPDVAVKRAKHKEYIRNLCKSLITGDSVSLKELTTGDAGENLIDRELSAEIRHLMTDYGVARREFFVTQLSKNQYDANALVTDVTVGWVSEGNVIPTVSINVNQEELKLNKLAAIATMSRELLEDQEIDLFSFIAGRVAEGFAKAEDTAFFMGDGTSATGSFTGLSDNASIEEVEYDDSITAEKIYEMVDTLPQGAHGNAKFYTNRTHLSQIRLIKDGDGRYIYQNPLEVSGVPTLAGYPLVLVEAMPTRAQIDSGDETVAMFFGDLRKSSILGFKGGIAVDRFNAGVVRNQANDGDINLITTDREAVRWVSRVGAITILPSAVVRLVVESSS